MDGFQTLPPTLAPGPVKQPRDDSSHSADDEDWHSSQIPYHRLNISITAKKVDRRSSTGNKSTLIKQKRTEDTGSEDHRARSKRRHTEPAGSDKLEKPAVRHLRVSRRRDEATRDYKCQMPSCTVAFLHPPHARETPQPSGPAMTTPLPLVSSFRCLFTSACDILKLLSTKGINSIMKDVENPSFAMTLKTREKNFKACTEYFEYARYINPIYGFNGNYKLRHIIYIANLASLLLHWLIIIPKSDHTMNVLSGMSIHFPGRFIPEFDFVSAYLLAETNELRRCIKTQVAILAPRIYPDRNPLRLLLVSFFDLQWSDEAPNFDELLHFLLPTGSNWTRQKLENRIHNIRAVFDHPPINFEKLDEMFPWTEFLTSLWKWCWKCEKKHMEALGGISGTEELLIELGEAIKEHDKKVELNQEPPASRRFIPNDGS